MTEPTNPTDYIVDKLAAIGGVMRADISVSEETVTTYIPTDQLEAVQAFEDIDIEVLEDYDHEQLISATNAR